jgi:hypothetical protein
MKKLFPVICSIIMLSSCAPDISMTVDADNMVIFPPPPSTPRIQYLTSLNTSLDISGEQTGLKRFIFGEQETLPILKPYGIVISENKIYICDTGIRGLEIIDLENNKFEYFIPQGRGALQFPVNATRDEKGRLFIADANRKQIVVFDNELKYMDAFGQPGDFKPTGIHYYDNRIWVASVSSHRIYVYDADSFDLLFSFPEAEKNSGHYLYQPLNIFVNDSAVYITDFGEFKIKKYSHAGQYTGSVGAYGNNYGQFTRPKGLAADSENRLYVVDAAFENVQIFNSAGELLMAFGGSYPGKGSMSLPAGITISQKCMDYFEKYVYKGFILEHLVFVSNQFGPEKISVYGFISEKPN